MFKALLLNDIGQPFLNICRFENNSSCKFARLQNKCLKKPGQHK